MGFSGFGRAKVKEGAVKIGTAVASKLVGSYRPSTSGKSTRMSPAAPVYDQSRVGSSLTSKSKTRGKLKSSSKKFLSGTTPYAYKPKRGERCRKGYKFQSVPGSEVGMCVKID